MVYLRHAGGQSQFSPLFDLLGDLNSEVEAIQEYLLNNLELNHSLTSLAARVHMSPRNLSRLFTKEAGMPPMTFLTDARIDAARRYLETTEQSIKEISHRCGFENPNGLRRVFIKRLAISPGEYRSRFRSETVSPIPEDEKQPAG
ncbi:GlxA family transcriptional regulator [Pseudomonas sp. LAMO17WK12:I2]|uniref:GlxA family transcriptional regulator n=1 Tax=unclassified Pseudomonas TaxID=196821 RepID=UPI0035284A72